MTAPGGVTLQLEVDACQKHLEIEKLRLEERLQYHWDRYLRYKHEQKKKNNL
jgi:sensor histidine kinase YesM